MRDLLIHRAIVAALDSPSWTATVSETADAGTTDLGDTLPAVICTPISTVPTMATMCGDVRNVETVLQFDCVGRSVEQALWLRDAVEKLWTGRLPGGAWATSIEYVDADSGAKATAIERSLTSSEGPQPADTSGGVCWARVTISTSWEHDR